MDYAEMKKKGEMKNLQDAMDIRVEELNQMRSRLREAEKDVISYQRRVMELDIRLTAARKEFADYCQGVTQ